MKIALTGGIGSGKSYVCRLLEEHDIKVYDCDAAAKRLMHTSHTLQTQLKNLVGEDVYASDGTLQKRVLAQFLLASEANKMAVNNVVHPAVAADFLASGMTWLESAILFESGFNERVSFDAVVCVTAPREVRIERIMNRDGISADKAAAWIDAQTDQAEVARRSQWVIVNDGKADLHIQIDKCLEVLAQAKADGTE